MRTALVLGFGPFPGAPRNPSGDLARAVGRRRRPALAGARIVSAVLPTTYAAVANELPALLRKHDPDIVLFFGLATRTKFVRVESRAVNAALRVYPDASRKQFGMRALIPGAPAERKVRAPVQSLLTAVSSAGTAVYPSRDAGRYICNAALFTALDVSHKMNRPPLVAFVHIPRPRSPLPAHRGKRTALPTMTTLVRAGEAVLATLLAAARRG